MSRATFANHLGHDEALQALKSLLRSEPQVIKWTFELQATDQLVDCFKSKLIVHLWFNIIVYRRDKIRIVAFWLNKFGKI